MSRALVLVTLLYALPESVAGSDDFELLDGTDFLLLDGTNFLLFGV